MQQSSLESSNAIRDVGRIDTLPALLQMLSEASGLGFIGVARVTEFSWTACAVHDPLRLGMEVGTQLDIGTTFCAAVRKARQPVVIDQASADPVYKDHLTPKIYGFESIVTVPIIAVDGECFGALFGIDRLPKPVSSPSIVDLFNHAARVIALQLDALEKRMDVSCSCDRFMTALASDMRRPVEAIIEAAELLERKFPDATAKELAAGVKRRARLFEVMADHMRDVTACATGHDLRLRIENADLDAELNRLLADVRHAHPHRRIIANVSVRRPVRCDPARVVQLASLLLESALGQASPGGPVSMAALIEEDGLSIDVWNGGEAFSEERLARIFSRRWQPGAADTAIDALSLHVCRLIVDAHGGSIAATSSKGQGTLFSVRLPSFRPETMATPAVRRCPVIATR